MKTNERVCDYCATVAKVSGVGTLALIGAVGLWTPFPNAVYLERWFAWPTAIFSGIVPLLVLSAAVLLLRGLGNDAMPFLAAQALFIMCFAAIGISFYLYMVSPSLTIWQVAASPESLYFLLVGTVVLVPGILAYTAYSCWVFRDKTQNFH